MDGTLRIAIDDGVAYVAWSDAGPRAVRLSGKMRRAIREEPAVRPVVGDLVVVDDAGVILEVAPRRTLLARRAAGTDDGTQIIAANVDVAFVATAVGVDLNERRLERYLAVVRQGGVEPVIVLTKVDLSADVDADVARVAAAAPGVTVLAVSTQAERGIDAVRTRIGQGRIAALLGSSGVGKSTLVNALVGDARQLTGALKGDGTGRHTTTRRELFALPGGGLLLDTPGMREVGLVETDEGIDEAFADVLGLAEACGYSDCSHSNEPGCAVRKAIASGALAEDRLVAWRRLRGEASGKRARRR